MNSIRFGWWLCGQALGISIWIVPALMLFFFSIVRALRKQRPNETRPWKHSDWLIFSQVLFYPAMIALGVVYESHARDFAQGYPYGSWGLLVLNAFLLGSSAHAVFWIWRMKGFRWRVAFLMLLMEVPILLAWFVAGMSITWSRI